MAGRSTRVRLVIAAIATLAILAPLAWLWLSSLVGKSYSVMGMGYLDYGGGPVGGHDHGSPARSVSDIVVDPARKADLRVDLVAAQEKLTIGGRSVPGYILNGTSPGPTITARQGQLVEVHVRNASVKAGIALHWHGYDVPAAMDGVAGVTQDEIPVGGEFTYRFLANQVGTYWYHSHHVLDGETYDIAFVANNPGIWLDHCHHLKHAEQGMVAHLMYEGVSTPYRIGGTAGNQPE
jgi:FtsP/CotA-like multicopper oxidase with cupredoxin domain